MPGGDSELYFFLAYAHTPERPWVAQLYNDLRTEVLERTTLPVDARVGFMDEPGIPLGSDWRDEVAQALATCKVFVPLYSPRYFTRTECGFEWHAFAQRVLDHRARHATNPAAIIPALWTPVDTTDMPEAARRIQVNHGELGTEYAQEGFYTLIKNGLYRQSYVTAIQRLARRIIEAGDTTGLEPCQVRDLGPMRNAFDMPGRQAPADRRLNLIVAAPTVDRLPPGRCTDFYGPSPHDWNPFHPGTRQSIADYAAAVARLNSYEPTLLTFEEGCEFFADRNPSAGLGLLLLDAWAGLDDEMADRLVELDASGLDWVGTMVPWSRDDPQTAARADDLRRRLRALLPHHLGAARPYTPTTSAKIGTLEQFRTTLPDVLEGALLRYLNHAEAHPPAGAVPPRPLLTGPTTHHER